MTDIHHDQLPRTLTLLPVRGAVLMPRAHLPVPIFDIDYVNTVTSSSRENGLVGVVQPAETDDQVAQNVSLYAAGTLARITEVDEVEDGKMLAVLEGICRFDVLHETININGYRQAEVSYERYYADLAKEVDFNLDRPRLFKALTRYFKALDVKPNWQEIDQTSNERLITALMMICPFDANEKQALLESPTLREQSEIMTKLIEFAAMSPATNQRTVH